MTRRRNLLIALLVSTWTCSFAWADAKDDLAAGRAALAQGDTIKALPLLRAAAEALPESVEAQLALAECQLQSGRIDEAVKQYQSVLKLSPNHTRAKAIVDALAGQRTTIEQKLAAAAEMAKIKAYVSAFDVVKAVLREPIEPAQREQVRLLASEYILLSGNSGGALTEAALLAGESQTPAVKAAASTMAALAAVELLQFDQAQQLLKQAGNAAPKEWLDRQALVSLLVELHQGGNAVAISGRAAAALAAVPDSPLRQRITQRLTDALLIIARQRQAIGDLGAAPAIIWPMLSAAKMPGDEAVLKETKLAGGWLGETPAALPLWNGAIDTLMAIATVDANRLAFRSSLLHAWLAAEAARQMPGDDAARIDKTLVIIEELAMLGRHAPDRKAGAPLTQADTLQRALLLAVAPRTARADQADRVALAVITHIARYEQARDLPTGLLQWVTPAAVAAAGDKPAPAAAVLIALPPGAAKLKLWQQLIARYTAEGKLEFDKAAATLDPKANETLTPGDRTALSLAGQLAALVPADAKVAAGVEALPARYADAGKWDAAMLATQLAYAGHADPALKQLAVLRLHVRRALADEVKLLVAGRKLPAQLDERIVKALSDAAAILKGTPREAHRATAISLAEPLIDRYTGLQRFDLADAVIAALAAPAAPAAQPADVKVDRLADLRDWALWTRAAIAQRRAVQAIAIAAREGDSAKLPLHEQHKVALTLYGQIVTGFPDSTYAPAAVEQVVRIAGSYETHRAFDTAAAVLADFIKAHPPLAASPRLPFELALISLHKAQRAFDDRTDKLTPPTKLSDEFNAAITALSDFIKAHPAGAFTPLAEKQLLGIVRLYGSVDAWPVAREALARLIAAGPPLNEQRSPGHHRLLEAATYLGELDRAYGLRLLDPAAAQGGSVDEQTAALAKLYNESLDDASKRLAGNFDATKGDLGGVGGGWAGAKAEPAGPPALDAPKPVTSTPATPAGAARETRSETDTALAMIRQGEQQHLAQIARLNSRAPAQQGQVKASGSGVVLPGGALLSEAAMKRQDEASDKAYAILLDLIKTGDPAQRAFAEAARAHLFWVFTFFEGQQRPDRALAVIQRYLTDRPTDPDRITLAFRALNDRVAFASSLAGTDRLTQAWADERHERFEKARADIAAFIKTYTDKIDWVNQARVLAFDTYLRESELLTPVSPVRAAGLLARGADELLLLLATVPNHPDCGNFPSRMWNIADRLVALGQREQAIYILNRITAVFPTHDLARQAVLRIAQTYATDLGSPLRAVETYQEFLSLSGDTPEVRDQIFAIGTQLSSKRRYVEALHVYGVFVDSFPADPKAAAALQAIGAIHQSNEAWNEAVAAYERIISEYGGAAIVPQVKLAVAECHINLSQWYKARRIYEDFVVTAGAEAQGGVAKARIDILKNLDRYQKLLEDKAVDRNKDDAQFQIARIVLDQLQYTEKAIREFRKVVAEFPKSHLADDAQYEIGMALLRVARLDEARQELLKVVAVYPNSPLADNSLNLVGQSFEQEAQRLSGVTVQVARAEAFERGQRAAYQKVQSQVGQQSRDLDELRKELKKDGKTRELGIEEAYANFRFNDANGANIAILNRDAECQAEAESAMEVANRQDRINEAFRQAVTMYAKAAADYPLGDKTSESLLRMAEIYETQLKDKASAMATYQKIVKFFPGTPVAEDAAWKVAQFHDQQTQYEQAVQAYRDFIRNYPASKRVGDAQYAMAESLEQLGRWVEAMDAYETFREKFSKHPKAPQAQEQINWIKAYRK